MDRQARIGVVGAGTCGLAFADALRRAGFERLGRLWGCVAADLDVRFGVQVDSVERDDEVHVHTSSDTFHSFAVEDGLEGAEREVHALARRLVVELQPW